MDEPKTTARSRYSTLEGIREQYLEAGRDASELTIPTLVPPAGHSSATKYYTPFQGVGARGVNNLSSKLLLSLFPPNSPFFRLVVDAFLLNSLQVDAEVRAEMDKALMNVEKAVQREVETSATRVVAFEALRQLVVAGNVLLYVPKEGSIRAFRLENYVVKRDTSGNLLEIVIKECVSPRALSGKVREAYAGNADFQKALSDQKDLDLFTRIYLEEDGKRWRVSQEICDTEVADTIGYHPADRLPYLALRFARIDGEDYGRGYVEEYIGDLRSLEALSQAVVEGSAAAARVLFLCRAGGTTRTKTITESKNGAVVTGDAADITVMQVNKAMDFQVAKTTMDTIEGRLAYAFLLNSSIQRQAERVTAEEIRFMAQELESALGGTYSILSQEFQLPLVELLMGRMSAKKGFPKLKKKMITPVIVTGVEALGRGNDLTKLDMLVGGISQALGPGAVAQFIHTGEYLKRRATALGIDSEGLVKTAEELAAEAQQAQQAQMMQAATPNAVAAIGDIAGKTVESQQPAQ
jgi:hypothetical protein